MQAQFAAEILAGCKKMDVHTALDTAGFQLTQAVSDCLDNTDLVILDIKHTDEAAFNRLTGGDLKVTLNFLDRVADMKIPLWVRQVIVPGINDNPQQVSRLAALVKNLPNLRKIELLPYHRMAETKWRKLGLSYPLQNIPEPDEASINRLRQIIEG